MNVLLLIDSLGSGGAQRQICLLACELKRRGWMVTVMVYHPDLNHFGPLLARADVPVIRLRKSGRFSVRTPLEVAWHAVQGGYDAMLAFLPTPTVYGAVARALGGPPLVVSERSGFSANGPGRVEWLIAQGQRLAAAVVCNSHHHAARFALSFSWLRTRTMTIFNGAELGAVPPLSPPRTPLRLLAIGTVLRLKNFPAVIEALGVLKARGREVPLVQWAGKAGPAGEERAARDRAEQRLAELGLTESWAWLGERSDVPQLLAGCDAVIHASVLEGFPNAIGEALAAGRPVLASAVGDHARLIRDGETGFLFDPAHPDSIADAIVRLRSLSAAEHAAMSRRARETAESTLSVARMTDRYAQLLQSFSTSGGPAI